MMQRGYRPMETSQISDGGLFDPITHTQGGLTHLIQLLWDEYLVHLQETIDKRSVAGKASVSLTEAIKRAPATDFAKFCADYLVVHRPIQSFFIDGNLGLLLSNQKSVAISPGVEIRGTMQDAGAVQVTEGVSQKGLDGIDTNSNISLRV